MFISQLVICRITAEVQCWFASGKEGEGGLHLSEPLRDHGIGLVGQGDEIPPVTEHLYSKITLNNKQTTCSCQRSCPGLPPPACLLLPMEARSNGSGLPPLCLIHSAPSFVCMQFHIVSHGLHHTFSVGLHNHLIGLITDNPVNGKAKE